ncbi:hypothetical protein HanPI659440_Chr01g0033401 [Helianthus annuus]|nr:hypothetical protein HanIR_Chr01g0049901 [Helianthus annuus]KAJ0628698.1 hypothetical protein HanHA89_Chr01g0039271 [Helianthus annuus]KAJ0811035.1 hypothetical protein HanPI659440_Chr01g0033401 [Helianthus annuus]
MSVSVEIDSAGKCAGFETTFCRNKLLASRDGGGYMQSRHATGIM